jgi:hypothetical protein
MAFTDNCNLCAAVHEEGLNPVIQHIMLQPPSMFKLRHSQYLWQQGSMVQASRIYQRRNILLRL